MGPEIDPGVPALAVEGRELAMAIKSGNFGGVYFYTRALEALKGRS
jgi:3-dehydrotetronate 4-kinase